MKKVITGLMLTGMLVLPTAAIFAACSGYDTEPLCRAANCMWNPDDNKCYGVEVGGVSDIIRIINTIGNWIFAIALAVAAIFILVAAFFFITSGGNPETATKAKGMLVNALIGVALALAARGLVAVLKSILGAA